MKKIIIPGIMLLTLLTGCGKERIVTCTNNQNIKDVEINTEIKVKIKNTNFISMDMTVEATLPDSMLNQKQMYVDAFKKQYIEIEDKYGVQPTVTETEKGAKVNFGMTAEQAKKFNGIDDTKTTKEKIIEVYEEQGYTCK